MHVALMEIEKVDGVVFPLLKMEEEDRYLAVPDVAGNDRLQSYVATLEKMMDLSLKSTKKQISAMQ